MFPLYSGNLPEHQNYNWENQAEQRAVVGTITGVYYVDHERNPYSDPSSPTTSSLICYQVTCETRRPVGQVVMEFVTASGQLTGIESWDQVDVLPLGLGVRVDFTEGDVQRPVIVGTEWDFQSKLLHNAADGPKTKWVRRGFEFEVDKNGDVDLKLRDTGQLRILDSDGNVILRVLENGNIELGGTSGLSEVCVKKFYTDVAAALAGLSAPLPGAPSSYYTSKTKAK